MTWQDLKHYIDEQSKNNDGFLKQSVCVYNYDDGEEHEADIIELLEENEDSDSGWITYLTINEEVEDGKIKETGIS